MCGDTFSFLLFVFDLVWAPIRGIYHLWNPDAYDKWKIENDFREEWKTHLNSCKECSPNFLGSLFRMSDIDTIEREAHAQVVLSDVIRRLEDHGDIRGNKRRGAKSR